MERLQKRELSRKLAQATHISIGDAEKFVVAFFSTLAESVTVDGEVEVYGFGTFSRDGFVPCPQLADAVNKPFVNFTPVEISVDVEVDELINQEISESQKSETTEVKDAKTTTQPETSEIQNTKEIETSEIQDNVILESPENENSGSFPERKSRILWLWLAALTVVVLIMAGIYFKQYFAQVSAEKVMSARVDSVEMARLDSLRRDSIRQANVQEFACHYTLEEAKELMPYSAYRIDGTLTTDTVKKDQTLEDIAKIHGLPYGEFIIQLHNGIESVKEGQIIKIPLLKRK